MFELDGWYWYNFWTGGPIRNFIYERMKRILGLQKRIDEIREMPKEHDER